MEGKDTKPRQRKTFESRIQDAFQNGMTPEFFRWAMQTDIDAPVAREEYHQQQHHQQQSLSQQQTLGQQQQQSLAQQQQQQQHQEQQQLRRVSLKQTPQDDRVTTRTINISDDESQEGQQGPTAADLEAWRADALPCFAPLEWLNDNAVSLLIKEVVKKSQDCGVFTPYQQESILWNKSAPKRLEGIKRHMDLFTKSMFVAPLCNDNHWVLFVCFLPGGQVHYYDSMENEGYKTRAWEHMRGLLDVVFSERGISFSPPLSKRPPQQRNGSDCGLHVIRNADLATCAPGVDFPNIPLESSEIRSYYRQILEGMTLD